MAETKLTLVRESGCTPPPAVTPSTKPVTITVDGKPVTVPDGSLVIQACERAQSPVPFYCYHPGLSISGNCRICLVEIVGQKKLQIACNTRVAEGMSVQTTSDPVLEGRRSVLEYLLVNHPLDCPVCDQAGECWLQDYYMQHGLYDPKFNETKHKKPKRVPLGPTVMLDAERCILCSRCVRFTDEITKTGEFGIFNRGDHAVIGIQPGTTLDNNYSGNVVDICPVGALTDRDFRFKCRVWYLGSTKSVCTGCSRGCNVLIQDNRERDWRRHIAGGERIMRLKPRYHPDVNQWWMCDEGRYGYRFMDHDRLTTVRFRDNGTAKDGTWPQGLEAVAGALRRYRDAKALGQVGVILSSYQSNENLFAAKRFFGALGIANVVFQRPAAGRSDDLLLQADKSPNARGAQALGIPEGAQGLMDRAATGDIRMLYVCGADVAGLFAPAWRQAAGRLDVLVFQGPNRQPAADAAHVILPSAVHAEQDGTFTNFQGRVQRFWAAVDPLGDARPDWQIFGALAQALGLDLAFPDAAALFAELAKAERPFAGLSYESLGEQGALLKA